MTRRRRNRPRPTPLRDRCRCLARRTRPAKPAAPSPYWGDEAIWNSKTTVHSFAMDGQGRVTKRWVVRPEQGVPKAKLVEELAEELAYDGLSERVAVVRRPSVVAGQWHEVRTQFNNKGQPVLAMSDYGFHRGDGRPDRARGCSAVGGARRRPHSGCGITTMPFSSATSHSSWVAV